MAGAVQNDLNKTGLPAGNSSGMPGGRQVSVLPVWALCMGLVVLVLACYLRTLGTYFLADDFGQVSYAADIWAGQWQYYWLDWISNTQRLPGMAVYRPWFITSLVIDYGLWHANAFGYYLTIVIYYLADVLLLFGVVRKLTESLPRWHSLLCAFFSAALFAVSPLHPESISWSGGRTDTICCAYFLASFLLFLCSRTSSRKGLTVGALVCYWLGLLTKEMAIALPVIATATAFLFDPPGAPERSTWLEAMKARLFRTAKETMPYWLSTAAYFVVRFLALGTLGGGYIGGFDGQYTALSRVLDIDNYHRLIFPLAIGLFEQNGFLYKTLLAGYLGAAGLIVYRCLRRQVSLAYIGLLLAWIAATAVPIYQVWGLGMNLEGARYFFFLTVPMSLFLPLLLFGSPSQSRRGGKIIAVCSAVVLAILVFANYKLTTRTNGSWIEAGKEVRACTKAAVALAQQVEGSKPIPLLGIPKKHVGAHMIYNGQTLLMAVSKPFFAKSYAARFNTFDPPFFGPDQFINSTRFKAVLAKDAVSPHVWNGREGQWTAVTYQSGAAIDPLRLSSGSGGLQFSGLNVNPLDYDYVQFDYFLPKTSPGSKLTFNVEWKGSQAGDGAANLCQASQSVDVERHGDWQTVRVPVSHYWHWYSVGNVLALTLMPPADQKLAIRNVALVSDQHLRPVVALTGAALDNIGIYNGKLGAALSVDVSNIADATRFVVEVTKPNFYFDSIDPKFIKQALYHSEILPAANSTVVLDSRMCPPSSYCEIRVRALDSGGRPLGEYTDPLTLFLSP